MEKSVGERVGEASDAAGGHAKRAARVKQGGANGPKARGMERRGGLTCKASGASDAGSPSEEGGNKEMESELATLSDAAGGQAARAVRVS